MKKYVIAAIIGAFSALTLSGCGGGGGGGGTPPTATKAISTVYLFNAISSNRIATVQTTITVPSGVMVNYSSPPGAISGIFPLRSGFVVPSGPVRISATDISGNYDTSSGTLLISMVNIERADLRSGKIGSGTEIAQINFKLVTPGVLPVLPTPWQYTLVVGQESSPTDPRPTVMSGCNLNFATTYQ